MKDKLYQDRLTQLQFLESKGINPYPQEPPQRTHKNQEVVKSFDELQDKNVDVVGRIMGLRGKGKMSFIDIEDESGKLQIMISEDIVGKEIMEIYNKGYSIGDFVGINGKVFKTIAGEISVKAEKISMLSKSMLPVPPRKTQQKDMLSDPEARFRQRYLDLLVNPEVIQRFKIRSQIVQLMRERFNELGCWEVETPILDTVYGGASARPFTTHHNTLNLDLFLRISNELYLKKLIVGGFEGVYEFSRDFRNEGMDWKHNPEFTQVELYKAYTDYNWQMEMMENLISDIAKKLLGTTKVIYQEKEIDLKTPWKRLSIYDGIKKETGIDFEKLSKEEIKKIAIKEGITESDPGHIALELFDKYVEPKLINPTFIIDYPESTSPLTKLHRSKSGVVERFECIVAGMEVANCYTELNDSRKQRANFEAETKRKEAGDEEAMPMDEDFIKAMEYGMPPMGGIGISIDRWCMLLTDTDHIREVILFPLMKPKD
jgi:lysyl-tRNA synthetase, class II